MIKLIDNYVILSDAYNYILATEKEIINKKQNDKKTIRYTNVGYFNSVASCIKGLLSIKCKELVSEKDMELKEYYNKFIELNTKFEKLLNDALKEKI